MTRSSAVLAAAIVAAVAAATGAVGNGVAGDPEFADKVQTIREWWEAYGKGTPDLASPAGTN